MTSAIWIGTSPHNLDQLILSSGIPMYVPVWASPSGSTLTLAVTGLPSNVAGSFNPTTIGPNGGVSLLELSASSALASGFRFTVNASANSSVVASALSGFVVDGSGTFGGAISYPTRSTPPGNIVTYTLNPIPASMRLGDEVDLLATLTGGPASAYIAITLSDPDPNDWSLPGYSCLDEIQIQPGQPIGRTTFKPGRAGPHTITPVASAYPNATLNLIDPPPINITVTS